MLRGNMISILIRSDSLTKCEDFISQAGVSPAKDCAQPEGIGYLFLPVFLTWMFFCMMNGTDEYFLTLLFTL